MYKYYLLETKRREGIQRKELTSYIIEFEGEMEIHTQHYLTKRKLYLNKRHQRQHRLSEKCFIYSFSQRETLVYFDLK